MEEKKNTHTHKLQSSPALRGRADLVAEQLNGKVMKQVHSFNDSSYQKAHFQFP